MNKEYNQAARPVVMKRPQLAGLEFPDLNLDQGKIVRWVIVPGGTILALVVLSSIFKGRK